ASQLVNLNLTPGQLGDLLAVAEELRSAVASHYDQMATILEERIGAVLAGESDAVNTLNQKIATAQRELRTQSAELLGPFREGLTERQEQLLTQILGPMALADTR